MNELQQHVRKKYIDAYIDNAITLLKLAYPKVDEQLLKAYIEKIVQTKYTPRLSQVIVNESYGNAKLLDNIDVLKFFNYHKNRILSPSGSVYNNTDEKKSLMYEFIKHYLSTRKVLKKEMLKAEEAGDTVTAQIKNYGQATVKIRANSIIGGTGSEYSFCYNKAAFNSVTSLSRNTIMNAYAFTERFLGGNIYLPTYDHFLNYLTIMIQKCPDANIVNDIIKRYNLYEPNDTDLMDVFFTSVNVYTSDIPRANMFSMIHDLQLHQKIFIYYANNFYLLAKMNSDLLRNMIRDVFVIPKYTQEELDSIDPKDLFTFDGDLLIVLNTHYAYLLGDISLYDSPKEAPNIAKQLVLIARHMQQKIQPLMDLIKFFCHHHTSIADTIAHKEMYRKVVANSDTDSVIFTTKEWVKWYTGSYNFTQDAFDIDVLVTYFLSKTVAWLMYTISEQRGALGEDLYALNMKNEFLYPVMMSCIIPKHYVGPQTMREGHILPKPNMDIKGVSFRGSSMQKITLDNTENFLTSIINDIYNKEYPDKIGSISIRKYIQKVIEFELHILRSLKNGETTFLSIEPIKYKSDYKDPDVSMFFNYTVWCNVFQEKYGEIHIPTKCHIVPLNSVIMDTNDYKEFLHRNYPDIFDKLYNYISTLDPKKKISRIPINPVLNSIPQELIPLIDSKTIVYKNCSPMYLALESLGLSNGIPSNKKMLFTDLFGVVY